MPKLPGLNGRAVRRLRHVQTVRSIQHSILLLITGFSLVVTAGIAVPAYAQATTVPDLPQIPAQTLTLAENLPARTLFREGYTVTAPPPLRWPLDNLKVADGFGPRTNPCDVCTTFHPGVDFDPGRGAQVHAIADGVVVETVNPNYWGLGTHAVIRHEIDGVTIDSVYGHMQQGSMSLQVGDEVNVGQVIGLVGSTGASTGPHLHFEIRIGGQVVNPLGWMHSHLG